VIITEYDLPRPLAMPHDVQLDSHGMVWYGDFGAQYVGRLDPKTGKATEYKIPMTKPGAPTGNLDIQFDRDGMLWIGAMMQGLAGQIRPQDGEVPILGFADIPRPERGADCHGRARADAG